MPTALHFTPDAAANRLLASEPLAVMIGMLLDQQVPMEWAFNAPAAPEGAPRRRRSTRPRSPRWTRPRWKRSSGTSPRCTGIRGSMAKRTHALCAHLVEHYGGRADGVWTGVQTGDELLARVVALPGFGKAKARIFVGLLGKRLGVQPPGWELVAADWPSIADVDSFERVLEIREKKRAMKAAARLAAEPET